MRAFDDLEESYKRLRRLLRILRESRHRPFKDLWEEFKEENDI
jgi:hypothetical protein